MAKSACGASNACSLCALHQRLANYSPRAFQQKTGRCLCSPMRRLSEYTYPRAPGSMHMPARGRTRHLHASARRAGAWRQWDACEAFPLFEGAMRTCAAGVAYARLLATTFIPLEFDGVELGCGALRPKWQ